MATPFGARANSLTPCKFSLSTVQIFPEQGREFSLRNSLRKARAVGGKRRIGKPGQWHGGRGETGGAAKKSNFSLRTGILRYVRVRLRLPRNGADCFPVSPQNACRHSHATMAGHAVEFAVRGRAAARAKLSLQKPSRMGHQQGKG